MSLSTSEQRAWREIEAQLRAEEPFRALRVPALPDCVPSRWARIRAAADAGIGAILLVVSLLICIGCVVAGTLTDVINSGLGWH